MNGHEQDPPEQTHAGRYLESVRPRAAMDSASWWVSSDSIGWSRAELVRLPTR